MERNETTLTERCDKMSLSSSTEKVKEDSSLDEDSGHDSVDSLHTPVDERERIEHLATAVAWIRQEVVSAAVSVPIVTYMWSSRSYTLVGVVM